MQRDRIFQFLSRYACELKNFFLFCRSDNSITKFKNKNFIFFWLDITDIHDCCIDFCYFKRYLFQNRRKFVNKIDFECWLLQTRKNNNSFAKFKSENFIVCFDIIRIHDICTDFWQIACTFFQNRRKFVNNIDFEWWLLHIRKFWNNRLCEKLDVRNIHDFTAFWQIAYMFFYNKRKLVHDFMWSRMSILNKSRFRNFRKWNKKWKRIWYWTIFQHLIKFFQRNKRRFVDCSDFEQQLLQIRWYSKFWNNKSRE